MDFRNDKLVMESFALETTERLAEIENGLIRLEREGKSAPPDLVDSLFRYAHSFKAEANLLGFKNFVELSHEMENILDSFRKGELTADELIINGLLAALDKLRQLLEDLEHSDELDVAPELKRLDRLRRMLCAK